MPDDDRELQEHQGGRQRRMLVVLLALGALMLVIAIGTATRTMFSITEDTDAVQHTLEVETTINALSALGERLETARRGYIIQPEPSFAANVRTSSANFEKTVARLRELVADNPAQLRRIERIEQLRAQKDALIAALFASPEAAREAIRSTNFDADRGVLITRELRNILDEMNRTERALLTRRNQNQLESLVAFYLTGGLAIALLLATMGGAIWVVTRLNRDLTSAQGRLRLVNEGLEDAVAARTTELTRANEEIQRFAYIVSHDLRSPLVNVLGFTSELDQARKTLHDYMTKLFAERPELRDQAAWLAVEEDLPEALGFIRTSTQKMDRLINSILELSRQGRRVLHPETLDMTALAQSVTATLRQRADTAGASVSVAAIPPIESDRIAVEQILSNLVENALKYLDPARPGEVRVAGERRGGMIEIAVTDNGRGIAPADHERIFDLFRRAGTQDQPGEGIGLANVRALAYRLGGRIGVESQLGEGARFTLTLPEKFAVTEQSA